MKLERVGSSPTPPTNEVRREMRIEKVEELAQILRENPDLAKAQVDKINHNLEETLKILGNDKIPPSPKKRLDFDVGGIKSKYKARRTEYNCVLYASKKEAEYAKNLDLCKRAGEIQYWLRQVPFTLPGGIVYRADFMEVNRDGSIDFVDVKGYRTEVFKIKKRLVEALYPIKITEV